MKHYSFSVLKEHTGMRIDVFLSNQSLPFSRSQMQRRIEEGEVTLSGKPVKAGQKVKEGQQLLFHPAPIRNTEDLAENIPLEVLYEDRHLIVINKPAFMVVHPAPGHESGTLVNALLFHCGPLPYPTYFKDESGKKDSDDPDEEDDALGLPSSSLAIGGEHRPGIVHRLDQGTSGILVCAKDELTLRGLQVQFQDHSIEREYCAIVEGVVAASGSFHTRYGRHHQDRKKFTSHFGNKHAITHYKVIERLQGASLVKVRLETGRTHQIRVHFSESGHPILGDPLYGNKNKKGRTALLQTLHKRLSRQALHARVLGFIHPRTNEALKFSIEPPEDFLTVLKELRVPQSNLEETSHDPEK